MNEVNAKYQVTYVPSAALPRKVPNPDHQGQENVPAEIDVAPAYEGRLVMRLPTWEQRLEFMAALGATPENPTGAMGDAKQRIDLIGHLSKVVPDFVVGVELVRVADKLPISTWEDVRYEGDLAQSLVPEMAMWLLGKHNIGSPSVPS